MIYAYMMHFGTSAFPLFFIYLFDIYVLSTCVTKQDPMGSPRTGLPPYPLLYLLSKILIWILIILFDANVLSCFADVNPTTNPNLPPGRITWWPCDYWKLAIQTFVGKVMSLLFNILSRFVRAFLPRSRCLLILWCSHHLQ